MAIRRAQRRFENKRYGAIGAAGVANRISRWRLRKIIRKLKSAREGTASTEGNNCCWKNWAHRWIYRSLLMEALANTNKLMIREVIVLHAQIHVKLA